MHNQQKLNTCAVAFHVQQVTEIHTRLQHDNKKLSYCRRTM